LTIHAIVRPVSASPAPLRLEPCRERGRDIVSPALPLIARLRRNRFAGWLGVCLMLLQVLAAGGHVKAAAPQTEPAGGYMALVSVCWAPASLDGQKKAPRHGASACVFHAAGCAACPAIVDEPRGLLSPPPPFAAKIVNSGGARLAAKAERRSVSVRGPPAPSGV
jgi:hypothetical protein